MFVLLGCVSLMFEHSKRTLSQNLAMFCGNFFVCERDVPRDLVREGGLLSDLVEDFLETFVFEPCLIEFVSDFA